MFTTSKPKRDLLPLMLLRHITNVNEHTIFQTIVEEHVTARNNRFEAGCDSGGPLRPFLGLPIEAVLTTHEVFNNFEINSKYEVRTGNKRQCSSVYIRVTGQTLVLTGICWKYYY
jgi:hypothetical protein